MKKSENKSRDFSSLRAQAEKQLADTSGNAKELSPEEAVRLVHELNVHQIELELQNESLRNAELDLNTSRQRYADLFDGAPVGYFILDRQGQILDLNFTGAELLGVDKDCLTWKPFLALVATASSIDTFFGHLEEAFKTNGVQYCEIELKRNDGTILSAGLQSAAVKGDGGAFVHFRTAVLDLTERRQITSLQIAEEKLQKAHDTLYNALESITDGFFSLDRSWRFTYVNTEAEKLLGKTCQELLGNTIWEMFAAAKGSRFQREYERAMAENKEVQFEEYYPPFKCWYEVHAYPSVVGLSVYFRNVTERRQAEANRVLMTELLRILNRGSGELHRAISEVLRLIKQSTGFDAVGLRMRKGCDYPYYEQRGFSDEFVREENFLCAGSGDGTIIRDADGTAVLECTCGLVVSGRTDPSMPCFTEGGSFWTNISSELLKLAPQADPRTNPRNNCIHTGYQSVALIPVRSGGEIIGLLQLNDRREGQFTLDMVHFFESLADNIGLAFKRMQVEEALRENELHERARALELERLGGELEYKNEELESIIRIASHDLRSPLMNIKGFSSELAKDIDKVHQMLKELPLPEQVGEKAEMVFTKYVPEAIDFIQTSAEAINRMLKSLMSVAKAGTMPIVIKTLDMNALVADIAANYQFRLIESGGTLTIDPLPECRGDADQITQVFSNLIGNAIKYREPKRPLKIHVHASADESTVTYCVEDNGKGIAAAHQDKVFDLFTRLDSEAGEGEGIGLTIVKRMVERQGGKILVESEVGKGSKFFVSLQK